jgi:flagellar basal-body rod protein FlgF
MIKGLYSAVSAMIMNANREQVISHNVANMDTPGFKQVLATQKEYITTQVQDPMSSLDVADPVRSLGSLGLGVQSGVDAIDFTQGGIQTTDNPLDLAIEGTGFFEVKTPDGNRYTRDGRFSLDASGTLVTSDGYQVLDKNGQSIKIESEGTVDVSTDGEISVDGKAVAQLNLSEFDNPAQDLQHDGGNLFLAKGSAKTATNSTITQGALESSNVDSTQAMSQMMEISRLYEAAQQMVQNQDSLLGETISTLGKTA